MWEESLVIFICLQYSLAFTFETDFLRGEGNHLNGLTNGTFFHAHLARIFVIIKTNNRISVSHRSVCSTSDMPIQMLSILIGLSCPIEAFANMYVFITSQ